MEKPFKREMKVPVEYHVMLLLWLMLSLGNGVEASSYNYSATIECLVGPQIPQYGGGIVANPAFDSGLEGWTVFGKGKIEVRKSMMGNQFMVAYDRTQPRDSFAQRIYVEKELLYTFSAWVQISKGNEMVVAAYMNSDNQTTIVGSVLAQSGCWSMLKGGLTVSNAMSVDFYFEIKNTSIELWVDNVSLQPFTKDQWRNQQSKSIEKVRKRKVRFHISNNQGKKLQGATITLIQTRPHFPLGCATASTIITNKGYQDWFIPRFTATTFDNEMKWYYTERKPGHENYSDADAMLAFAKQHRISVRGHTILWANPRENMKWVGSLSPKQLLKASVSRLGSVMSRYTGEVIAWDVMNENLHFSFFEDKLGRPNASAMFFKMAQALDPKTTMFMNEYNTMEFLQDLSSSPTKYLQKLKEIKSFPGNEEIVMGIGLQGHFDKPNIPYIRASLDTLGATNMPIWLTELDVRRGPNQAKYLEEIMREAYSHHSVQGMIVWSGWKPSGCSNMCLTDNNFVNLPAGDVVDKLIKEWKTEHLKGVTDVNGVYEHIIFHGEYIVSILSPETGGILVQQLEVPSHNSKHLDVWLIV